ncbi:MAG: hypothetical protein M3Q45_04700 [Chloroflexota bacterium]|nr:hypothetical protein [Chloroflexota bacterium]
MRNKRIYILFIVLGLLAALTTTVYAATNRHPAAPSIVGVWDTTIKVENTDIGADGLWTFSADGNFLDINSTKETNPGVWIGSGNTYVVTFWAFNYDEQGQYAMKAKIRASIRMDGADQFTGEGVTDVYDLEGKLVEHPWFGPFEFTATRVEVELP